MQNEQMDKILGELFLLKQEDSDLSAKASSRYRELLEIYKSGKEAIKAELSPWLADNRIKDFIFVALNELTLDEKYKQESANRLLLHVAIAIEERLKEISDREFNVA